VSADNHVLTFDPLELDVNELPKVHRRGWRKASTFTGFCDIHDNALFAELEKSPFVASEKQCFLVGYRAVCHELFQKASAQRAFAVQRETLDRGLDEYEQLKIQHTLTVMDMGREAGYEDLEYVKQVYDKALIEENFNSVARAVFFFEGDICIVSTGTVHTDFDVHGVRLQDISDLNRRAEALAFGIVSTDTGGAFVFSWLAEFQACNRFVRSILEREVGEIPSVLVEFIFAYVANTYFSEKWWRGLDETRRARIMELAGTIIQYGRPVNYSPETFVDWKMTHTAEPSLN